MNVLAIRFAALTLAAVLTSAAGPAPAAERPRDPGGPGFDPVYEPVDDSLFGTSVPLVFSIDEGRIHNRFYRRGPVAAHMLVRSGPDPRLVVAFPAANEGAAVWFEAPDGADVDMTVLGPIDGIWAKDEPWGAYGAVQVDADYLRVRQLVLGSVRVIREVEHSGSYPEDFADGLRTDLSVGAKVIEMTRPLLDGREIVLRLELTGDAVVIQDDGAAPAGGALEIVGTAPILLKATALTEAEPLLPIPARHILQSGVEVDERDLQALAFLTYEDKLLAGSWRFLTYFGRDTLLSLLLLMPALEPAVVEAGLGSVLDRMSLRGAVAHEESIGDWAALEADLAWADAHDSEGPDPQVYRTPAYDYTMVDDDFLLAPVLAHYLLFTAGGQERAAAFLERRGPAGSYRELVRRNLDLVLDAAEPYAAEPGVANLIALQDGETTGEWRDSEEGLGGGRIPYSVNAALVPAALRAAEELLASLLLGEDAEAAARAHRLAEAWSDVDALFRVEVPAGTARLRVKQHALEHGVDPAPALGSLDGPVVYPAVALHADGRPVEVMHSDDGFVLLFGRPDADELDRIAGRLLRPFPAGLRTPVGVVVANPALASDPEVASMFTRDHYHGTVVWSWQQAMLADGLAWQLLRDDLPLATRARLKEAQLALWRSIEATSELRRSELWSWTVEDGQMVPRPFGQGSDHKTESNAVQLWSTVYIAVRPPG